MKKLKFILFFVISFFLFAENKTIIASGYGTNSDLALKSALRNAVEQVVGTYLSSESIIKNYVTVSDKILSFSQGYIESYTVINTKTEGSGILVTVNATIKILDLKKALYKIGMISLKMDSPRILVIGEFDKYNSTTDALKRKCYLGIVQVLSKNGFFIIDKAILEKYFQEQKDIAYSELNNKIAEYGLKTNADYIVRYDFRAEKDVMYADCDLISSSTGKVLLSTDKAVEFGDLGNTSEISKIIKSRNTGKYLAEQLSEMILENWKNLIAKGKYYTLIIEGYNSYSKVLKFEDTLSKMKDITSATEVESGDKKTTILIRYLTSRKELKNKLFKLFKINGWAIRLLRGESNRMFIKILKQ